MNSYLALAIKKTLASTGVFVRVVCALKRSISSLSSINRTPIENSGSFDKIEYLDG
jgi:hypothetical protein